MYKRQALRARSAASSTRRPDRVLVRDDLPPLSQVGLMFEFKGPDTLGLLPDAEDAGTGFRGKVDVTQRKP